MGLPVVRRLTKVKPDHSGSLRRAGSPLAGRRPTARRGGGNASVGQEAVGLPGGGKGSIGTMISSSR